MLIILYIERAIYEYIIITELKRNINNLMRENTDNKNGKY